MLAFSNNCDVLLKGYFKIFYITAGSCDFEEKSFCTWLNVPNANRSVGLDDFDWTLGSGSTPSYLTGPSTDHTTGTAVGEFFMYSDAFIAVMRDKWKKPRACGDILKAQSNLPWLS